ncbi:putative acyltransferase domain protein [Klebsiella pneumoniae]|nr:putative acyltransferase domain protein [Klebsiella pneumoniae]
MEILEGHNKFYVNDAQGNQVAEIVFVPTGEHLSIIEHTDVDPSLKGQGVGKTAGGEGSGKNAPGAAEDYPSLPVCQT